MFPCPLTPRCHLTKQHSKWHRTTHCGFSLSMLRCCFLALYTTNNVRSHTTYPHFAVIRKPLWGNVTLICSSLCICFSFAVVPPHFSNKSPMWMCVPFAGTVPAQLCGERRSVYTSSVTRPLPVIPSFHAVVLPHFSQPPHSRKSQNRFREGFGFMCMRSSSPV